MDKYQKNAKNRNDEELLVMAKKSAEIILSICTWIGVFFIVLGALIAPILTAPIIYTFGIFSLPGVLLIAMCVPLRITCKKARLAAEAEIIARGIEYKVRAQNDEKRAERKIMIIGWAILIILALLLSAGLHSCGKGKYTGCPKCGVLYDNGSGGANYINIHGKCAKCDLYD